jgi:hypothetical protein
MGRRARHRVEDKYAWDSALQCQLEHYRQLLGDFRSNDETADRAHS